MPDAVSVGAQFVLYKPEGALNYFFYDYRTGTRVEGADLARAKLIAEAKGMQLSGDVDKGVLYMKDADMNAWRQANPGAAMKSMPDPGPLNPRTPPVESTPVDNAPTVRVAPAGQTPQPSVIDNQIAEVQNVLDKWDLYKPYIENVRMLEKSTGMVGEAAKETGYIDIQAVRGFRQLVNAFPLVETVTPQQKDSLRKVSNILEGLESDKLLLTNNLTTGSPTSAALNTFLDEKMQQLNETGEVFILTGHQKHFNITRIQRQPDGSYTSTLYDSGHEAEFSHYNSEGRMVGNAVQENKIRPGTDIREMLELQVQKRYSWADNPGTTPPTPASQGYTDAKTRLNAMLEDPPTREVQDLMQRRGNCTTRGQRILAEDIMQDPALSDRLHQFTSNVDGATGDEIRQSLQQRLEYLQSIRDGNNPNNAWRQLDFDSFTKASSQQNYEFAKVQLESGQAMDVFRTKPGAFTLNELDNLQGTLERNGVHAYVRQSVSNPNEYHLYVPKEEAIRVPAALANDDSPAAQMFRTYGVNARQHVEVRNFLKATNGANYENVRISVGNEMVPVYRTQPGRFTQQELSALQDTLKNNGVNAAIRESTREPGQYYLYVAAEDQTKIGNALASDKSAAAQLVREYGNDAPSHVDGYIPTETVPARVTPAPVSKTDILKAGVWLDEPNTGVQISRLSTQGMSQTDAEALAARLRRSGFVTAEVRQVPGGGQAIELSGNDAMGLRRMRQKFIAGAKWQEAQAVDGTSISRVATEGMTEDEIAALKNSLAGEGLNAVDHPSGTLGNTIRVSGNDVNTVNDFVNGGPGRRPVQPVVRQSSGTAPLGSGGSNVATSAAETTEISTAARTPKSTTTEFNTVRNTEDVAVRPTGQTSTIAETERRVVPAGTVSEDVNSVKNLTTVAEDTTEVVGKAGKFSKVAGVLGDVGHGVFTGFAIFGLYQRIEDAKNGDAASRLLEANGVGPNCAIYEADQEAKTGRIVSSGLGIIPAGATQAVSAGMELAPYVFDRDPAKMLAYVESARTSGSSRDDKLTAISKYVDAAMPFYHYLPKAKQDIINENLLRLTMSGQLDVSQYPAALSRDNWAKMQSPGVTAASLHLPDVSKTRPAFNEIYAENAAVREVDMMRQMAQYKDVNWDSVGQQFKDFYEGKTTYEQAMTLLSKTTPSWNSVKDTFSTMLHGIENPDLLFAATSNAINRPADMTGRAVSLLLDDTPEPATAKFRPTVLDPRTGQIARLTRDQMDHLMTGQPDPSLKGMKWIQTDKNSVITATTLDKDELLKVLNGEKPLIGPKEIQDLVNKGAKVQDGLDILPDPNVIYGENGPDAAKLAQLADAAAAETDPVKRDKAQKMFDSAFSVANPEAQQEFIAKANQKQLSVAEDYAEGEKKRRADMKKQAGGGDGTGNGSGSGSGNGPGDGDGDGDSEFKNVLSALQDRHDELYAIHRTGLDPTRAGEFVQTKNGERYTISDEKHTVHPDGGGADFEGQVEIVTRQRDGKQFIVLTGARGEKLFGAFNESAGADFTPLSQQDLRDIKEAQAAERKKQPAPPSAPSS